MTDSIRRYILSIIASAMVILVTAGGCGEGGNQSTGSPTTRPAADADALLRIAVIPKGTTHEFWKSIHAGALKAETELENIEVLWKGPLKESDRASQINIVENFTNQNVDGIALAPLDAKALVGYVRSAAEAGKAVVIMDSGLDAEVGKDYVSFIATDNYVGGQKGGEHLGELLGSKGKVLLLRYMVGSASTERREQGFLDVMEEKYPDIEMVSTDQYGGATGDTAQKAAESLLQVHKDLDGVFCPNESTTFGMLRALQESGRAGKVKFVGFDSSPKLIEALREGELHGLVLQDPFNMGYTSVKTLAAHLRGEGVEPRIDTGSAVATPENMDEPDVARLLSPPIDEWLP